MKNTIKLAVLLLSGCIILSCNNSAENKTTETKTPVERKIDKAAWFLGKWHNVTAEGASIENWEKQNDTLYTGVSYFIKGKDTLQSESIQLMQSNNELLYMPTVKGQNGDKPVTFTMTSASDTLLVFENPKHDFPQKITYMRVNNDSLLAEISGTMQGQQHAEQFPMSRVK